jgi:integrase
VAQLGRRRPLAWSCHVPADQERRRARRAAASARPRGARQPAAEVFRRPDGKPYERLRDDADDTSAGNRIRKAFAAACRRAGIKDFTPHCCRHTWATWHYASNRDLLALQRLGGWKSLAMVSRYAHVNVGELKHTIDNLPWPETGGKLGDSKTTEAKSA